ncbi:MAG: 5-(carboxyamino)imidazole ribonucleotide mutase [Spirochaetes bacterium]|nr:5-(carboxyamino)imidazole ribonucleotide mutase [Spirochaetota bacterium]
MKNIEIGIVMGSDSDLDVMQNAAKFLDKVGIGYELTIVSAHRTPDRLYQYAKTAKTRGIKVIIAGAGGAAHLPGMLASITAAPIIGVPIKTSALSGVDSLYSILQMPAGIPVATVAINGAENAGILAASIIGVENQQVFDKVQKHKEELKTMVEAKAAKLENLGFAEYLKQI